MTSNTYRASAFLDAARQLDADVVVGSDRTQALAFANPDGHLTLDFADLEGAAKQIEQHAQHHRLDAVIATDDEGVRLAARAATALGLRGSPLEAVTIASDKRRTREALAAAGVDGPGFRVVALDRDPQRVAKELDYPVVLKPLGLAASRGVIRADHPAAFVAAFERIKRLITTAGAAGPLLVEDYMPGPEVALEGLLHGGRLRSLALFDKPDPLEGPYFEETIYVTPSRLDAEVRARIHETTARCAAVLGLSDGPVHAELRLGGDTPRLLEIAPRSIGGLCSKTLRFGHGVSLEALILRDALGFETDALEREPNAAGVMMIPIPRGGVLREVSGVAAAAAVSGIEDVRITIPVGHVVVPLPEGSRYLGFIFARAPHAASVEQALRKAHDQLTFDIENSAPAPANGTERT